MPNYFINRPSNEIYPEEILLDKRVRQERELFSRLEFPVKKYQIFLLFGLSLFFLLGVIGMSVYYQVFRFGDFFAQAQENKLKQFLVEAPRGIILDRYGKVLAENKVSYDLLLIEEELPRQQEILQQ